MSQKANEHDLCLCLDLAVPAGMRFGVWSDNGKLSVTESANGRRLLVFAARGTPCFLMGFPAVLPAEAEQLRQWYRDHPSARPVWFEVDEFGEAVRMPGRQPFPRAAQEDPRFQAVRNVFEKTTDREKLGPSEAGTATRDHEASDAFSVTSDAVEDAAVSAPESGTAAAELHPVLSVTSVPGASPLLYSLHGESVRLERREGELIVFAPQQCSFALAQVPEGDDATRALDGFFDEYPHARAMAFAVVGEAAEVSLNSLAAFERRVARRGVEGLDPLWQEVLRESEAARARELTRDAVPARALRRYLKEQGRAPRAIQGSDGTLYAKLVDAGALDGVPRVSGVTPDEGAAQVLRIDLVAREGLDSVLYAPAGGAYLLMPADLPAETEAPGQAVGLAIRPGGDRVQLGATERARIWAAARPLEIVHVNPPRTQLVDARSDSPASSSAELIVADISAPPDDLWDGPIPEADPTEIENQEAGFSAQPSPTDVRTELRWHGPDEGITNLSNWRRHSPRGELWMAELLTTLVDRTEDLDALGCLVPIQMLRQGYGLTLVDKERFQHAVDGPLADRLGEVRVFEIEGQSFFARDTARGLRLIGPRGAPVKSTDVRAAILATYGRDPGAPIVEPETYQHPSASKLSPRDPQRVVAR